MKKLLLILISIFMIMGLAGCGPSAKDEAKQFNDTYFTKAWRGDLQSEIRDKDDALVKNYPHNSYASSGALKISQKIDALIDTVKNVKIKNKEVEPLKENFIKYLTCCEDRVNAYAENERKSVVVAKNNDALKAKFDYLNEYSKLETGKELPTMTLDEKKYYATISSDLSFAFLGDGSIDKLDDGKRKTKAQGKYLLLAVAINNGRRDTVNFDSNTFHLIDKEGRQFAVSPDASSIQMNDTDVKMLPIQLNPTMTAVVALFFDVPATAKLLDFQLEAQVGKDKVNIDLRNAETGYNIGENTNTAGSSSSAAPVPAAVNAPAATSNNTPSGNAPAKSFGEYIALKDGYNGQISSLAQEINEYIGAHGSLKDANALLRKCQALQENVSSTLGQYQKDFIHSSERPTEVSKLLEEIFQLEIQRISALVNGIRVGLNGSPDYTKEFQKGTKAAYEFDDADGRLKNVLK